MELFIVEDLDPNSPKIGGVASYSRQLLEYLAAQSQVTLLDAPPVLGTADVSILAPKVDGVVLVVGQALSSREHVSQALKQLEAMRAHVLGLIFVQRGSKSWGYDFE